jgi:hypothetical protein
MMYTYIYIFFSPSSYGHSRRLWVGRDFLDAGLGNLLLKPGSSSATRSP